MQGPIAQIIALTLYGNAAVQGHSQGVEDFFPSNSTFTFCEYVKFVDLSNVNGMLKETSFAETPNAWINKIKDDGVSALRLIYGPSGDENISDRMLVGFVGGGGRWLIETISPTGSDYWEARWEVGNRDHPEKRIWQVTYGRVAAKQTTRPVNARRIGQIKADLSSKLKDIAAFARQHNLDGFANAFDNGYAALHSDNPNNEVYHKDISPKEFLSLEANQLLAASQAAWVFGGMGSWNDMGFEGADQQKYERLSDELYQLLNESYLVAVNSSVLNNPGKVVSKGKPWWRF